MESREVVKVMESVFSENQLQVIKATIVHGPWGDAAMDLSNGEVSHGYGYCTSDAKEGISELSNRQIAGIYSGIAKIISKNNFDFISHVPDYWGEGNSSDGMLFIEYNVCKDIEKWARGESIE